MKEHDKAKLETFFKKVSNLTLNHRGLSLTESDSEGKENPVYDIAVVFPSDLGKALAEVDPEWWELE